MKRYLFSNFLKEKLVYQSCQDYWEIKVNELLFFNKISGVKPYLNTKFGDGTDFYNGNPILNYYFTKTNKAIRIIQEEPNPKDLEIAAWTDNFETENFNANELVISIQLTPYSEKIAYELIRKWVIEDYSSEKMDRFIDLKLELEKIETSNYLREEIYATNYIYA